MVQTIQKIRRSESHVRVDRTFHSPKSPSWTFKHKWAATAIVSAFTFISPVSSSIPAPASPKIAADFGVHSTVVTEMMTSTFVLAYGESAPLCHRCQNLTDDTAHDLPSAFGPLFLGPLSEIYGRSRVFQFANMWYLGM